MKKNLLGLFAILLALSLSAFTTIQPNSKKAGTAYFWYQVSGTTISSSKLNPTAVDKPTAMNSLTDCDDQAAANCLYGSTNPNLAIGSSIGSPAPDQLIKERQ